MTPALARDFWVEVCRLWQAGTPYLWGGKTTSGVDCSGLVTLAYFRAGGPDIRAYHGTDRLWDELEPVASIAELKQCGLVFYRGHVMVHAGFGTVVGACGGDSTTTTAAKARAQGAKVMFKDRYDYRPDVRGFRVLPLRY